MKQPELVAGKRTTATLRFSQLSAPRQALVRMCQSLNFGQIQGVLVLDGNPIFEPAPAVLIDVKLYRTDQPRPELALEDFALRDEVRRLMAKLDDVQNGTIHRIEVRDGIPRRVVIESRSTAPSDRNSPAVSG